MGPLLSSHIKLHPPLSPFLYSKVTVLTLLMPGSVTLAFTSKDRVAYISSLSSGSSRIEVGPVKSIVKFLVSELFMCPCMSVAI